MPASGLEIEVPRRLAQGALWALCTLGLILLGAHVSPAGENGPLLLSPRLAQVGDYRRVVQGWLGELQALDRELETLLSPGQPDLLAQNERANRAIARLQALGAAIESQRIPPTFEPLHALLAETAQAYLEAGLAVVAWIAEPLKANLQSGEAALADARVLLARLAASPWLEAER